jgi:hypothetical protein
VVVLHAPQDKSGVESRELKNRSQKTEVRRQKEKMKNEKWDCLPVLLGGLLPLKRDRNDGLIDYFFVTILRVQKSNQKKTENPIRKPHGRHMLRRFGASTLRRFGASTLRQAQRPKLSDRSSADTTDFRAYALENSEELRTNSEKLKQK